MSLRITPENKLRKIIIIGDRVLIKPRKEDDRTRSGLYLPQGIQEREQVRSGYIMKAGPGYAIPFPADKEDEPWKEAEEKTKYIPLQVKEGDLAVFLQKGAYEVMIDGEKYFIVSQASILMLEREEDL
jgi:chaperonin GroES